MLIIGNQVEFPSSQWDYYANNNRKWGWAFPWVGGVGYLTSVNAELASYYGGGCPTKALVYAKYADNTVELIAISNPVTVPSGWHIVNFPLSGIIPATAVKVIIGIIGLSDGANYTWYIRSLDTGGEFYDQDDSYANPSPNTFVQGWNPTMLSTIWAEYETVPQHLLTVNVGPWIGNVGVEVDVGGQKFLAPGSIALAEGTHVITLPDPAPTFNDGQARFYYWDDNLSPNRVRTINLTQNISLSATYHGEVDKHTYEDGQIVGWTYLTGNATAQLVSPGLEGNYAVKATTHEGERARTSPVLPTLGQFCKEAYMSAEFRINNPDWGNQLEILEFSTHPPGQLYAFICWVVLLPGQIALRYDWPDYGTYTSVAYPISVGTKYKITLGMKVAVDGFYRVWVDDVLVIDVQIDNSYSNGSGYVAPGTPNPGVDSPFVGIILWPTGALCELTVDNVTCSDLPPGAMPPPRPPTTQIPYFLASLLGIGLILAGPRKK